MNRIHAQLRATSVDRDFHERTCGYWYLVTEGGSSHTAFRTRSGLDNWLMERGLELEADLPERGTIGTSRILGSYREEMHYGDVGVFEAIRPIVVSATLSNGEWVLALIDEKDGMRTVHTQNPNMKSRLVFDRKTTDLRMM